ncbi:Catenin-beta-like protein [Hygrophoropsis aurantiaca]|uniref:Catenin-beta-like protein n=1 Tax=Hygrophoropsis aurantiaca TaxID=72124 RepID=A0ACB8ALM9_9AGAM|nr:Catenin-beta-like protein [Hygrophoropsis aurantiaca]
MDIDKLFKVPKLPAGNKRKMPDNPTPEMLKKMKLDVSAKVVDVEMSPSQTGSSPIAKQTRRVTVEDEDEQEEDSSFAPGGDADYFVEEDDEGRFFGGGLTSEQKQILSIFESAEGDQEDVKEISLASIRRTLLRFERAANKNQDQRSKYPDDPSKFIDSEADLDAALKSLLPLAQTPVLAYPELVRSGTIVLLIGLLSHENADIVIDVVEVIHELTDEDVGNEGEDDDEQEESQNALKSLIEALLENSILELLVENLSRLNEEEESDRQGVFHIMGVFENVLGFNPSLSTRLVFKTNMMTWLLNRIQSKNHDENRGYAAELLSILLQTEASNKAVFGEKDGVEIILKILSQFRRRDPVDADETEYMENLFDALCSALSEPAIKDLFVQSEGVELMVLIMKEKRQSKSRSIKTLDYAMSGGTNICNIFVEALGLKTLFAALMGKIPKKQKANSISVASEDTSHVLGIISSLLSNLPSDSPDRIRLLTKFVENNYEKVDKLLEIRQNTNARLKVVEAEIAEEKNMAIQSESTTAEEEDLIYLRRLDGGLFTLQTVDYIMAWIMMEDDGIRSHLTQMLERRNQSVQDIIGVLRVHHENIDGDNVRPSDQTGEGGLSQKDILENLISFLESC